MKTILDLCSGSGAWSKPYKDNGYNVIEVTLPLDIRLFKYPGKVYGILCAPPCTMFSVSGNRWKRTTEEYLNALSIVDACLRFVAMCDPVFWALENPKGTLYQYVGPSVMRFHPYEYGDPYKKLTLLWGKFNTPAKNIVQPTLGSYMHTGLSGQSERRSGRRSITPPGFAQAFFEANR